MVSFFVGIFRGEDGFNPVMKCSGGAFHRAWAIEQLDDTVSLSRVADIVCIFIGEDGFIAL